jgi:hypothetical protein
VTRTSKIIAGGFLVRAFLGQALFWISYLRLPIARSLQAGDGFWFLGVDGTTYLGLAKEAAADGFLGIVSLASLGTRVPSRLFIRLLAVLVAAFGGVASLAILINCVAYALMCAVLVRMGKNDVLLAAIAFGPAAILFSTQLLKDTLYLFLIVLMVAIFQRWQELWRRGGPPGQFLGCAVAMLAVVYALAGIRWYVAAIVWVASAVFLALVTWPARRRGWALATNVVLFVLLAQSVRLGGEDMPPVIARVFNPATALQWRPAAATPLVGRARHGFEKTTGATMIEPGWLIASLSSPSSARIPQGFAARWITGLSATFLPRFLARSLGLIRIGGGRGLWFFPEADTIVLHNADITCARALRRSAARVTPLFVLLILVFVFTAGPMIYTVNNFGTLFRLRLMLYVMAAVIPITLRNASSMSDNKNSE